MEMKTTMELPDDVYLATKTRAASQNRKIKDLVEEGLRAVLAQDADKPLGGGDDARQVLLALDEILRCPPMAYGRIALLRAEVRKTRDEGWSRGEDGR